MTVREAAAELHHAVANHFTIAKDCPPAIYRALLELRRALADEKRVSSLVAPEVKHGPPDSYKLTPWA